MPQYSDMPEGATVINDPSQYSDLPVGATIISHPTIVAKSQPAQNVQSNDAGVNSPGRITPQMSQTASMAQAARILPMRRKF
jgi:hypothetical protein